MEAEDLIRANKLRRTVLSCSLTAMAALGTLPTIAQTVKEPADRKAYSDAYKISDTHKQMEALQAFIKAYPKSKGVPYARNAILDDLLKAAPGDTEGIAKEAKLVRKSLKKGPECWQGEAELARKLAGAGTNGIDLPLAEKWAKDAEDHLDQARYQEADQAGYRRNKMPAPTTQALQTDFEHARADVLQSMARVDLAKKNYAGAERAADSAYAANPNDGEICELRGRIALHNGNKLRALDDFERAELLGSLSEENRPKLAELYREAHGGAGEGMQAALDRKYATLYGPANFTPAGAASIQGGHTVLLELFTGSACPPCVGGDMAVEALLKAYPRTSLVVLVFDQHIPAPDPLANTASADRAKLYDVHATPSYVLDGKFLRAGGWDRDHVKDIYEPLGTDVAKEAALPTSVHLKLSANRGSDGVLHTQATVTTGDTAQLAKEIVFPADATAKAPAKTAAPAPHLVVNFALVENDVRYSGENGVRFHSEVVRALAKAADSGYAVEPGKTATVDASFSPVAVSKELSTYLEGYAKEKDIHFRSTDTVLDPAHLAIAAWVQDTGTHRVLDAVIVPVEPSAALQVAAKESR